MKPYLLLLLAAIPFAVSAQKKSTTTLKMTPLKTEILNSVNNHSADLIGISDKIWASE